MYLQDENLYYVGGFVRDEFLGVKNYDIDYCYEGNAIEFAKSKGLNVIKENPDFGTVRVLVDDEKYIDIASTRMETYPQKGKLPLVSNIGCSLKDDLSRRDFAVNAMAKRTTDGYIVDLFGGLDDIKNKKLKVLHNESFIDDPTRILRGLKFSVRFDFELDEHTKSLQEEYLNNINYDMSYHRLKKELIETFNLNSYKAYDKFIKEGIYKLLSDKEPSFIFAPLAEEIIDNFETEYCWLVYLSCFDLSKIELTRREKRIIEWAERLRTECSGNNTPKESLLIHDIRMKSLC